MRPCRMIDTDTGPVIVLSLKLHLVAAFLDVRIGVWPQAGEILTGLRPHMTRPRGGTRVDRTVCRSEPTGQQGQVTPPGSHKGRLRQLPAMTRSGEQAAEQPSPRLRQTARDAVRARGGARNGGLGIQLGSECSGRER